jgi:PKD domain
MAGPSVGNLHLNWSRWNVSNAPVARSDAAMAYDAADGYLVLFSGAPGSGPYVGDTWTYANDIWKEVCSGTSSAPSCATEPASDNSIPMTYDAADHFILMVNSAGQTWSFASGTWTQRAVNQTLESGQGAALAFDPAIEKVVLVVASGGLNCRTYTYSNGTWTLVSTVNSIADRAHALLFYDPSGSRLVLFGGVSPSGSQTFNDMWVFSPGEQWTRQTSGILPPGGVATGFAFDQTFGYGILFTGWPGGNYTWVFWGGNWTNQSSSLSRAPPVRVGAMMAYDGADGYSLMFDGLTTGPTTLNDSWVVWGRLSASVNLSAATIDLGQTLQIGTIIQGGVAPYRVNFTALPPGCTQPTGATSFLCRPTTAGSFAVAVTVGAFLGGNATSSVNVQVNPDPTAAVDAVPNPTTVGVVVFFTVLLTGGTQPIPGNWTFGDGAGSTNPAIGHSYGTAGVFLARFGARDERGLYANATLSVRVNSVPMLAASVSRNVTDVGLRLNFSSTVNQGTPPLTSAWRFGDGGVAYAANATHVYATAGLYAASITVTDAVNVSTSSFLAITVNADPVLVAGSNVTTAYPNASVLFRASSSGGTGPDGYAWAFGDGSSARTENASHAYNAPGNYSVSLTLIDLGGFRQTLRFSVNVIGRPVGSQPPSSTHPANQGLPWVWVAVLLPAAALAGAAAALVVRRRTGGGDAAPPENDGLAGPELPSADVEDPSSS